MAQADAWPVLADWSPSAAEEGTGCEWATTCEELLQRLPYDPEIAESYYNLYQAIVAGPRLEETPANYRYRCLRSIEDYTRSKYIFSNNVVGRFQEERQPGNDPGDDEDRYAQSALHKEPSSSTAQAT